MSIELRLDSLEHSTGLEEPIIRLFEALRKDGWVEAVRELKDGKSGMRVVQIEYSPSLPTSRSEMLICKVGPGRRLRDEVERYKRFRSASGLRWPLGFLARLRHSRVARSGMSWLAALVRGFVSISSGCREHLQAPI